MDALNPFIQTKKRFSLLYGSKLISFKIKEYKNG